MTLLITGWQNTLFRFDTVSGIASSILFAWFIGCLLFTVVIYHLTNTFADRFPSDSQTVGDLAKAALSMNYGDISRHEARWNRQEVWEALRTIIVEQLGVKPEEVKESAGFVKDFGAD